MADKKRLRKVRSNMNVLTAFISTMLVLVLLGLVVFFVLLAQNFSHSVKQNFSIVMMLDDDLGEQGTFRLQERLKAMPCCRLLDYISRERATEEQAAALGEDPKEFMGTLMPASIEMYLQSDYANRDSLVLIVPELKKEEGVLDLTYPADLIDSLNRNIARISLVMLIVAVLLAVVSFQLINNTIRLWIHERRFLINTMLLVGASRWFISKPFLWKALWIGLLAAVLAIYVLLMGVYALINFDADLSSLVTWQLLTGMCGVVVLAGLVLTLACAALGVWSNLSLSYDKLHRY